MLTFNQLIEELNYNQSPHYHHTLNNLEPETAHLFRVAFDKKEIGINGIYVFQSSNPLKNKVLPAKPAVCITTIKDTDDLEPIESKIKKIRRSLWNLSCAPFIIIHLPNQIRVYEGFNYNEQKDDVGLIGTTTTTTVAKLQKLRNLLADFTASAIDTGQIWKSKHAKQLNSTHRVNEHLLNSLRQLGDLLKKDGLNAKVAHALIGKYVF